MASNSQGSGWPRAAGYEFLRRRFGLAALPHWHISEVGSSKRQGSIDRDGRVREAFPKSFWPGEHWAGQLEFALKYDGMNLEILAALFEKVDIQDLASWVKAKPQGQYTRRGWYLYEWMTGRQLPIEDIARGNYIDLLDEKEYYTGEAVMSRRHRVRDNMLGSKDFCPVIRRTAALREFEGSDMAGRCRRILAQYPSAVLKRAVSYLYTKETKSSFAIERVTPTASRTEHFASLLQLAEKDDFVTKEALVELQSRIVEARYANKNYRADQNYVGETVARGRENIHFIAPRPEDLDSLMIGLILSHRRMEKSAVHPVVHAAAIAFGFVFIHPFDDGNGRIQRFLIHNILARRGFTPSGFIFPVSAAMLNDMAAYDSALESFSKPLLLLVDYTLDENGKMEVRNGTAVHYRYPDMTRIAEALFGFVRTTIEKDMGEELDFLRNYEKATRGIRQVVDMPDRQIDLFIRFCLQNNGLLSQKKRASHFPELTDQEIERMQTAVQKAYS